ncbi:MAG: stage sporulation protein, partial [Blastocatellia bacterium]|nr:stage sporulation protein [Blastocatellia bacterium]
TIQFHTLQPEVGRPVSAKDADALLLQSALTALKGRRGAVLVLDPQTGRIRASVNSRMIFEESQPPGSTIKPFTTLAALESGILTESTRFECPGKYKRGDFEIRCSHVAMKPPFDTRQALAYSCNYFFSKLGEALSEKSFNAVLGSFGFGLRTGTSDEREVSGALPHGSWQVGNALGEGGQLTVTPAQLLTAYSALFNGGRLYVPKEGGDAAVLRSTIAIQPAFRSLLMDGMRGAVTFGTASKSELNRLPWFVFGKTGTSTPQDDYHTDGWFVGLAGDDAEAPSPEKVRLAVLVFLKRARGLDAAEAAKSIFESYQLNERVPASIEVQNAIPEASISGGDSVSPQTIRVRIGRHAVTREISLDDYVFGVLAAEGSTETELESLKALAVSVRTFAIKNARRHAREGFDFCDNTHCERFREVLDESTRPEFYELVHRAVAETAGRVLTDSQNHIAEAYFSAACGGMTANLGSLWGGSTPAYLRGVRDAYCTGAGYDSWKDYIAAADLLKALRVDVRTDPGAYLNEVRIVKRDNTGRAETIEVVGQNRKLVRGWDFKIIVGRTLGWNLLKSSKFEVKRQGQVFLFQGSGFGHGLGLCQLGAHTMATRGASYNQILDNYFPGARLSSIENVSRSTVRATTAESKSTWDTTSTRMKGDAMAVSSVRTKQTAARLSSVEYSHAMMSPAATERVTASSANFRASFPRTAERREVESALAVLEEARNDLRSRLSAAGVRADSLPTLELYVYETTGAFVGATGQPAWTAAVTRGRKIDLQPLSTLKKRGILTTTLRHEYAHAVIESLGGGSAPRWLSEGLAAYFAGEGQMLSRVPHVPKLSTDELDRSLEHPGSAEEARRLYAASYREVTAIVSQQGEAALWRKVAGR